VKNITLKEHNTHPITLVEFFLQDFRIFKIQKNRKVESYRLLLRKP